MLGFFLSIVLIFFVLIAIITATVSSAGKEEVKVSEGSILHVSFNQPIKERSSNNPFETLDLGKLRAKQQPGLNDILGEIKNAKTDANIKGIYLDIQSIAAGIATSEEIRNALLDFKKSGKFIYAYAEEYTQGAYYLASVSDKIYLNPQGALTINGLSTQLAFFKGTLDKLEIEPEVIRHGKYKSAIEPFIRADMSEENRTQIAGFVDPIWNHMVTNIAAARKLTKEEVYLIADSLKARNANDALQLKLVDQLAYYDQFVEDLNVKCGKEKSAELKLISLGKYKNAVKSTGLAKDKIAVIYANGEIQSGEGDDNTIGSESLAEAIAEARKDEKVKAIVLRVNSPGGSALASDIIWREVILAKKSKPVVVSMGDVAASGGYYISCAADKIFAQPNTITGSIGVFGLMFNAGNMFKNKLGITFDTYKTSNYTDLGTMSRPLTPGERLIMQNSVDEVYNTFTSRVAEGRKMKQADVDSIGQGRVWSGVDAKRIGLVDELGGIEDAIKAAASLAKLKEFRIKALPEQDEPFQMLMNDLSSEAKTWYMENKLGVGYEYYKAANDLIKVQGIQARTLYGVKFN